MTKLEEIKKRVVEAVPEISELRFGCLAEYITKGPGRMMKVLDVSKKGLVHVLVEGEVKTQCVYDDDIISHGREIGLADVMRAIRKRLAPGAEGNWSLVSHCQEVDLIKIWNLSFPLSGQSPSTIDFLHSILITKE